MAPLPDCDYSMATTLGAEARDVRIEELNKITTRIIGAAMKVHSALGPGLLKSAYEACLAYELAKAGLGVVRQQRVPIVSSPPCPLRSKKSRPSPKV
jgi:hypothetical protein